jgi:hypothetical protein
MYIKLFSHLFISLCHIMYWHILQVTSQISSPLHCFELSTLTVYVKRCCCVQQIVTARADSVLYTANIFYSYSQLVANIHNLGNEAVSFLYI